MNLNKVFILGNVTRNPEIRSLPSGQPVANFGLATNRFYKDSAGEKKQDTEFHNVVAFGRLADLSSRYLNKGSLILVEGRLKTRSWQNSSGMKQYRTEVIAENIQLSPRSISDRATPPATPGEPKQEEIPIIEENYTPPAVEKTPDATPQNEAAPTKNAENEEEIDISKIPF